MDSNIHPGPPFTCIHSHVHSHIHPGPPFTCMHSHMHSHIHPGPPFNCMHSHMHSHIHPGPPFTCMHSHVHSAFPFINIILHIHPVPSVIWCTHAIILSCLSSEWLHTFILPRLYRPHLYIDPACFSFEVYHPSCTYKILCFRLNIEHKTYHDHLKIV